MKVREPRNWNLRPAEARELQERLRWRVVLVDRWKPIRTVAGADIALDARSGVGFSGVVVYRFPDLVEVERRHATRKLTFP